MQPNNQPYPQNSGGWQPQPQNYNPQGQPYGPQNQPYGPGNPPQGQSYNPQGGWQPQGPVPQPPQPKQPMDPATKKKLTLGISIGVAAVVVAIVVLVVVAIINSVDYSPTYRAVSDLRETIYDMRYDNACEDVAYYNSAYVTEVEYGDEIQECKDLYVKADNQIQALGETAGIKKNSQLSALFSDFKAAYTDASSESANNLGAKLELYRAVHQWYLATDELDNWDEADADIDAAANILVNSGNDTFKTYAETWATYRKAAAKATRDYDNASYSDSNKSALREEMNTKRSEYNNYVSEHRPDFEEVIGLNLADSSHMYQTFQALYNAIVDVYEGNYTYGSSDCYEYSSGEVDCD